MPCIKLTGSIGGRRLCWVASCLARYVGIEEWVKKKVLSSQAIDVMTSITPQSDKDTPSTRDCDKKLGIALIRIHVTLQLMFLALTQRCPLLVPFRPLLLTLKLSNSFTTPGYSCLRTPRTTILFLLMYGRDSRGLMSSYTRPSLSSLGLCLVHLASHWW